MFNSKKNKIKIIFSAFSCTPGKGSEPGVGWGWPLQAAKNQNFDVTVLTRSKYREIINAEIKNKNLKNIKFIYVNSSQKLRNISIYLEYIHWQYASYRFLKENYKKNDFDYFWHLTFGTVVLPIWSYKLPYKFIWGPVGGGEVERIDYLRGVPVKNKLLSFLKFFIAKTQHLNFITRAISKKASKILVKTKDTKSLILEKYKEKVEIILETRMDPLPNVIPNTNLFDKRGKIHICYTGRLVPLKNVETALDAITALLDEKFPIVFDIVGEGYLKNKLIRKARKYVETGCILFHGQLSRERTLEILEKSAIFAFPSLREGGSWSLMEAMILGKAIVCFDISGMHEMLTRECAILVNLSGPENQVRDFQNAIKTYLQNIDLIFSKGVAVRKHTLENFSWNSASNTIDRIIKELEMKRT